MQSKEIIATKAIISIDPTFAKAIISIDPTFARAIISIDMMLGKIITEIVGKIVDKTIAVIIVRHQPLCQEVDGVTAGVQIHVRHHLFVIALRDFSCCVAQCGYGKNRAVTQRELFPSSSLKRLDSRQSDSFQICVDATMANSRKR